LKEFGPELNTWKSSNTFAWKKWSSDLSFAVASAIRSPDGVDSKPNDANHALEPLGFRNRKLATSMPMALQADLGIAGAGRHLVEAALKLFFVREIVE
jgi:hypothetical protein